MHAKWLESCSQVIAFDRIDDASSDMTNDEYCVHMVRPTAAHPSGAPSPPHPCRTCPAATDPSNHDRTLDPPPPAPPPASLTVCPPLYHAQVKLYSQLSSLAITRLHVIEDAHDLGRRAHALAVEC